MYALAGNYYRKSIIDKIYNVGIYLRLSREDENSIQSESISNQKEYLMQYVLEQGWNLVEIYTDDGFTGTDFNRPDFKRMLKDIEGKRINLIITKDLSRLGRDYIETGYYLERYFPENNIRYIALNDGIDTFADNSSNNDMSPFKSVMNDMYAKDISKKVRTAMTTKRINGQFIGSFAPYGYLKDPENKNKLIIDPETAPIVKRIFDMYVSGNGYAYISNTLNKEGIPNPAYYKYCRTNYKNPRSRLNLWTAETIRLILSNPTYAGNLTQKKHAVISYKLKKLKAVPRDEWITVEDTHEPIVDAETFEFAQMIKSQKVNYETGGPKHQHLLSGLIFCGDCGERMTYSKTQKGEMYCICSKYKRFKMCTRHSILEKDLEQHVLTDLRKISRYTNTQEKLMASAQRNPNGSKGLEADKEIRGIEERFNDIKKTIKSLYEDKLKGIITETDFFDLSQEYNRERERLTLRLAVLNKKKQESQHNENQIDVLLNIVKGLSDFTNIGKPVLAKLINKIEIFEKHRVVIHYKFKNPF